MESHLIYLLEHYGYFGIMFLLILGIVGLPIPDEFLLTYIGYNVFLGKLSYVLSLASVFIGAIIGISISYFLGIKLGSPFLHKFGPRLHFTEKRIETTHRLFEKFGPYLLFIGYFIPGVRHITAYLAGINTMSFKKFALFAYTGAVFWGFTFITLGRTLGKNWHRVEFIIDQYRVYFIVFVLLATISVIFIYWRKAKTKAIKSKI
ncbi:DedA family protein [Schinkia azotoformans]|uniref:Alkaline phosphatase n=1 Tax=Schinkia azotoformans LMG 9581 TaxID=1131731 RepID=K6E508_SCHAZ|nr:DedA family protein [Schinkia azotoformans]EKN68346.1 alkaline phosphatase [Schinkia azotoformans LMG 9581]MEC1638540.1 DedA family protein [Schinkia azotoformans]MEC1722744.1 DedA family protein [Schinkia azotoformans]MEC1946025.1 DedA family protein [Schinkia azotoformans]MED4351528.1 DedA family protein [Schinkia azotoformans]